MTAPIKMTKSEMRTGLMAGRRLIQEQWTNSQEIDWVDELIAENIAVATPWEYKDNFECQRRVVTGHPTIQKERERCAKIVEQMRKKYSKLASDATNTASKSIHQACYLVLDRAAADIRKGTPYD